jgi:glycosyltransferase involved in cell wall biosynthesis
LRRLFSTEQVAPGVLACKALNILPWGSRYWLPKIVNSAITSRRLRRVRPRLSPPVILWVYDPGSVRMIGACAEEFAVYDCVDDYPEQATSRKKRDLVAKCDRMAAKESRLVFTTSKVTYERHRHLNSMTHLVPNAGDYEHFSRAGSGAIALPEVDGLRRPVLGFAGNFISSKIDFDLLEKLSTCLPQSTLLLIGPVAKEAAPAFQRIAELSNVRWLGPKSYAQVPGYVAKFDVALIPYVSNAYTRSCFPLKLYEYLAAGKPVVASGLPELAKMEPDVILTNGGPSFVQAVQEALSRTTEADQARRRRLAARNSWETRTERLLALVQEELQRGRRAA